MASLRQSSAEGCEVGKAETLPTVRQSNASESQESFMSGGPEVLRGS